MDENAPGINPGPSDQLDRLDVDDKTWDAYVAHHPCGHLLQTSHWGHFKAQTGWEVERLAVGDAYGLAGGAMLYFRRLPLSQQLIYVPKGPVVDWNDPETTVTVLHKIHQLARRRGAFMLKLEPEALDGSAAAKVLLRAGFCTSGQTVQPRSTIWIPLCSSQDDIRAQMKSKTRYNIGLSERKGIAVRLGTLEDVPAFCRLMEETGRRDNFAVHEPTYYEKVYHSFAEYDACALWLAYFENQLLAGLMAFCWGKTAYYLYGASSNLERNRMPNYALQWTAIRWAKDRGCQVYDLWGIPDEVGQEPERYAQTVTDRSDGLWNVYRFKQGFGGQVVRYAGAFDYAYDPLRYRLYGLALQMRRAGLPLG